MIEDFPSYTSCRMNDAKHFFLQLELEKVFSQFGEVKNSFIASEPGNRGFTYG